MLWLIVKCLELSSGNGDRENETILDLSYPYTYTIRIFFCQTNLHFQFQKNQALCQRSNENNLKARAINIDLRSRQHRVGVIAHTYTNIQYTMHMSQTPLDVVYIRSGSLTLQRIRVISDIIERTCYD